MSTHAADAGMRAVARVRGVRESDSRVGLQTALRESRSAQASVDTLRGRIDEAAGFATGSAAEFLAVRSTLTALGEVLLTAETTRETDSSTSMLGKWPLVASRRDSTTWPSRIERAVSPIGSCMSSPSTRTV